jgi:membrane-bound metal-dependent hydrolase YbcI (DUF457 family)
VPFTPFHFGPHACVSLPFCRHLDVSVFLAANVAVDIEPLLVLVFKLDYPLHGYCHTLLIGGLVGLALATAAYPLRNLIGTVMNFVRLPYQPTYLKMALSGVLGAWLHVLFDAPIYDDIQPFYPWQANPLLGLVSPGAVYSICLLCFVPALILYVYVAFVRGEKEE